MSGDQEKRDPGGLDVLPDDRLERWIVRLDAGLMSIDDQAALDRWLGAAERNREQFAEVSALWYAAQAVAAAPAAPEAEEPAPLRRGPPAKYSGLGWTAALAASLALAVAAWQFEPWYRFGADLYLAAGAPVERTLLPDGSTLWSAPGTVLEIDLTDNARALRLVRGSVRAQVTHDVARPFSITSGAVVVTVTGTDFGVTRAGEQVSTALLEGRVEVDGAVAETVVPEVGEVWAFGPGVARTTGRDARVDLGWSEGVHSFVDWPLAEVLERLQPYLGVRILATVDPALRVTATLRSATLAEDLTTLLADRDLAPMQLPGLWIIR